MPPPDSRSGTTSTPSPPRELIERERERWGHGTARAVERGMDNRSRKGGGRGGSATKKSGARRPRAKADRGRGPMVLCWRMYNVELGVKVDPGKDFCGVSAELLAVVAGRLGIKDEGMLADTDVVVARKSFDARTKKDAEPRFSYTLDVRLSPKTARKLRLRTKQGDVMEGAGAPPVATGGGGGGPSVVVVGAGPAGLFAALELVEVGMKPIIVERGMPVERRGREIGALFHRRILNPDSNLCYGEGGAGTWSDGKLTTRIGRNSENVRKVLETLVAHGAPERILVDGKPHLGTDRLVRILRDMRAFLIERGATFRFDTKVEALLTRGGGDRGAISGLKLADGSEILADRVILAVGHSARPLYERLLDSGVSLEAKGIAVGFRIEHPQEMINELRYGAEIASMVDRGKGKVPVADYRLTQSLGADKSDEARQGSAKRGYQDRSCYSFCMCPGGQVVPTSVDPKEVCVNGMSFSKRESKWANAALVVSLSPKDVADDVFALEGAEAGNGPLRGVRWQSAMERRAAEMGGGNLVVPVQRVTDFMAGSSGRDADLPSSSYRLGVRAGPLHELYPSYVTEGLREALEAFERRMPGFVCDEALLHGVETRTSSPVQVERNADTLECPSMEGLFPTGEGAGYAGGIVSAAVDGIRVGQSVAMQVLSAAMSARNSEV
ncbi:Hypothetical protein in ptb 5\'region (ORF1) [Ectocarpus siliculosus]|uniref:Uncharacterized protein n=1 Tax=Ectocarpus siliculosus TaxID=2880 RepID=D7FIX4_ECTSI|nr:Hypothetical protein in ptb 5\'region (ORF1) [Ectocarpus siliculosus]|eukprot:CBJ28922.1 Hypothetical protein in ptb 5\'region (ORF1) [Ectocarpus siliculosus]